MFWPKIFFEFRKCFFYTMNGFIDDDGIRFPYQTFEHSLSSFFDWQKSEIQVLMTVYTACDQCWKYGRGSWNRSHLNPLFYSFTYEYKTRIRNPRCTSIRNESNLLPFFEEFDDLIQLRKTWMRMKWKESPIIFDLIMHEKLTSYSSVFTGYIIRFFECPQSSECYIFEISDGGWDDGEDSGWWNGHVEWTCFMAEWMVPSTGLYQ